MEILNFANSNPFQRSQFYKFLQNVFTKIIEKTFIKNIRKIFQKVHEIGKRDIYNLEEKNISKAKLPTQTSAAKPQM